MKHFSFLLVCVCVCAFAGVRLLVCVCVCSLNQLKDGSLPSGDSGEVYKSKSAVA